MQMWCPNNACIADQFTVTILGTDDYRVSGEFGTWRVTATLPCCTTCGVDLSVQSPVLELSADWVTYLTTLAG